MLIHSSRKTTLHILDFHLFFNKKQTIFREARTVRELVITPRDIIASNLIEQSYLVTIAIRGRTHAELSVAKSLKLRSTLNLHRRYITARCSKAVFVAVVSCL
ncbi:hypothetical protein ANTPLA_LOCUS4745 [Anthophora plagiata]